MDDSDDIEPRMDTPPHKTLMVCVNRRFRADQPSCANRGSMALAEALEAGIEERQIDVTVERTVCMSHCPKGPTLRLAPGGKFILGKTIDDVAEILDELEDLCGVGCKETPIPLDLIGS